MQLKRELKHLWYFLAAHILFSITAIAYAVALWGFPLILLLLTFTKIEKVLGAFVAAALIFFAVLLMWVFKNKLGFVSLFFGRTTNLLEAPARYGLHLLDRINQENMTPNRDK